MVSASDPPSVRILIIVQNAENDHNQSDDTLSALAEHDRYNAPCPGHVERGQAYS